MMGRRECTECGAPLGAANSYERMSELLGARECEIAGLNEDYALPWTCGAGMAFVARCTENGTAHVSDLRDWDALLWLARLGAQTLPPIVVGPLKTEGPTYSVDFQSGSMAESARWCAAWEQGLGFAPAPGLSPLENFLELKRLVMAVQSEVPPPSFIAYMEQNYPPGSTITKAAWHADRIWRAAMRHVPGFPS